MKHTAHATALLLVLALSCTPAHAIWGVLGKLAASGGKAAAGAGAAAEAAAAATAARNAALAAEAANAGAHAGTAAAGANATRSGANAANAANTGLHATQSAAMNGSRLTPLELSLANSTRNLSRFCVRAARGGACDYQHAGSALVAIRQARGPNVQIRTGKKPGLYEVLDLSGNLVDVVQAVQQGNSALSLSDGKRIGVPSQAYVISCRSSYDPVPNNAQPQAAADWSCQKAGSREMAAPLCTRAGGRAYTVNAGRISAPVACPG